MNEKLTLKEKLIALKDKLLESMLPEEPSDAEFYADLEDHRIGNQNIYRLYYVNYHRIGLGWGYGGIGEIDWAFDPFTLPEGMTREEAFKVLSYLTDFIEKREDIELGSFASVKMLNSILYLERFGFKKVKEEDESKILDLFTINGRVALFKQSSMYQRYFEWYSEGVSREEVEAIYAKHNMPFEDIVWLDKEEKGIPRKLTP